MLVMVAKGIGAPLKTPRARSTSLLRGRHDPAAAIFWTDGGQHIRARPRNKIVGHQIGARSDSPGRSQRFPPQSGDTRDMRARHASAAHVPQATARLD